MGVERVHEIRKSEYGRSGLGVGGTSREGGVRSTAGPRNKVGGVNRFGVL